MSKLTEKQEAFSREYLIDLNATQAAIRAGYSEKTANEQGSRLLANVKVQKRISELKGERNERLKVDADYVLERHIEIDQLDVMDIVKNDLSGFKALSEWPKSWRTSVSAIDISEIFESNGEGEREFAGLIKKIKWPDKTKNLELLGKHVDVQAYSEKLDVAANVSNVMIVPGCSNVDEWEQASQAQHSETLGNGS